MLFRSLAVLVIEGSMVFDDTQDLELRSKYILVKGQPDRKASFIIGTELHPHKHKAIITLEGNRRMRELPLYGAKVLAVRHAHVDFHGEDRFMWTRLSATAPRGAHFIDIRERNCGWRSGEELVLAPTDYWPEEAEYIAIDRVEIMPEGGDRVHLVQPLLYDHYGEGYLVPHHKDPTPHDGQNITEMSAEVGLLTHNIVVRGDDQTYDIQFGAQIFFSSPGDESLLGRLEGVEVRDAGQGFFLGRYAVHFHLVEIGRAHV